MMISQLYGGNRSADRAEAYEQSWFYWYYKDFGRNRTYEDIDQQTQGVQLFGETEG